MKRRKFLSQLKKALKHNLSAEELKENIEYYDQYIRDEVKKGKSEEEVVASLGDPWIIAKTVRTHVDLEEDESESEVQPESQHSKTHHVSKAKIIMIFVIAILILVVIIAFVLKLFALLFKIGLPLIAVFIIVRLITKGVHR